MSEKFGEFGEIIAEDEDVTEGGETTAQETTQTRNEGEGDDLGSYEPDIPAAELFEDKATT